MANPHRGEYSFQVGEQTYTLLFSVNSLCMLEEELGESINTIAAQINNPATVRMKTIRALVWAGLQEKHPATSLDDAGRIITDASIPKAMAAVGSAFAGAFPDAEEAGAKSARPRRAAGGAG